MTAAKPPKKIETIEIRLSHEAKSAFVERCRREGQTASDAIRRLIADQPAPRATPRSLPTWRIVAAALAGAALGVGAAAPSFAHATQPTRATFDLLDRNHDGVLSYREFQSR